MLAYLLDENISFAIAEQIVRNNPQIRVESVHRWRGGVFVGQTDGNLLRAATQEGLTLVTYDLKTMPPLLMEMATEAEAHSGVILVDDSSIRNNDFGGLVAALLAHWRRYSGEEWRDRVAFLEPLRR